MGTRPPPDHRVQANPFLAELIAAGCNRYAELLIEAAEAAAKAPAPYDRELAIQDQPVAPPSAMDLDSTRRLADVFRQHATELLAPHNARLGTE